MSTVALAFSSRIRICMGIRHLPSVVQPELRVYLVESAEQIFSIDVCQFSVGLTGWMHPDVGRHDIVHSCYCFALGNDMSGWMARYGCMMHHTYI